MCKSLGISLVKESTSISNDRDQCQKKDAFSAKQGHLNNCNFWILTVSFNFLFTCPDYLSCSLFSWFLFNTAGSSLQRRSCSNRQTQSAASEHNGVFSRKRAWYFFLEVVENMDKNTPQNELTCCSGTAGCANKKLLTNLTYQCKRWW